MAKFRRVRMTVFGQSERIPSGPQIGDWPSGLGRTLRVREIAGSNPASPTTQTKSV